MVSIYIKNNNDENINGVVQVENLADSTNDGVGTFILDKGIYRVRGLALGYHVEQKNIVIEDGNEEFTLLATRG
jgi:hypothetical protein